MDFPLSHETKHAFFRAQVIAQTAGEREVSPTSVLAALLASPEITEACERVRLPVATLVERLEIGDRLQRLASVVAALATKGIAFASPEHIHSLTDLLPMSRALLDAVRDLKKTGASLSTFDVLGALSPATLKAIRGTAP